MLITLGALAGGSLATASGALASDLIVLAPDSATLSGGVSFDHVYVAEGATVRLAGDTTLTANDVYFAAGSSLRTCFVQGVGDNACTAGRSLTIRSAGEITLGSGISLVGGTGTPRPGGSLVLQGTAITVGGGIDTSGSNGAGSGYVIINGSGPVSVSSNPFQASINAPGGAVSIHGSSIALSGDLNTAGADATILSGGLVDLETGGPLTVRGNINASGHDNPAGNGAAVTLRGSDVRAGRIDASAGSSTTGPAGVPGTVDVGGTTSVSLSDYIDTRGASGASGFPASGGANVGIKSAGPVTIGTVFATGASADSAPPGGAGNIGITGAGVATGQLWANGGNRTGASAGPGATGSLIAVTSTGPLSVDEAEANGGNSAGSGVPGARGGEIDLTGDGVFTSELRTTPGTSAGSSPGGAAGPIHVTGKSFVTILGGGVFANGASASGGATNPPDFGGAGAVVTIHATAGPLSLGSPIRTSGGNGGNAPAGAKAGVGGAGGAVDLVGTPIDPLAGIVTDGGDGGSSNNNTDLMGNGGAGGSVHAWSETPIFGGLRSISTAGGAGAPPGVDGAQLQDSGPTGLSVDTTGRLSFTSQSPAAQGFNILRSLAGAAATVVLTTAGTSALTVPATAMCQPVTYQVVAFQNAVGWTSPATAPVAWTRQPSATQRCTDAPSLIQNRKVVLKQANLKKKKGAMSFVVQTNGIGTIAATATSKGVKKPLAVAAIPIAKAGTLTIKLKLDLKPKLKFKLVKGHQVARVSIKLVAAAPTGSSKTSITVPVEVRK